MTEDASRSALRATIRSQLLYLVDEIEAVEPVIRRVPEAVLTGRPVPGDRSIKEYYGLLAAADAQRHLPWVRRFAGAPPRESSPDERREGQAGMPDEAALFEAEAWDELPVDELLARVAEARKGLVEALDALAPVQWDDRITMGAEKVDLYQVMHAVIQHDTDVLRAIGHRLHEGRLGEREVPR